MKRRKQRDKCREKYPKGAKVDQIKILRVKQHFQHGYCPPLDGCETVSDGSMSPRSWAARGSGESDVVAADEADEVVAAAAAAADDDDDEADDVVAASDEADDVVVAADEAGEVVAADDEADDVVVAADEADEVVVAANEVVAASEANDVVSTDADGAADVTFALPSSRSSPPSPLWYSY